MVEKYKQDGKVAVLVRGQYGLPWSTANTEIQEDLLFNKEYVEMILQGEREDLLNLLNEKYNRQEFKKFYFGGVWYLQIEWVKEGELFRIEDHEELETVMLLNEEKYFCA